MTSLHSALPAQPLRIQPSGAQRAGRATPEQAPARGLPAPTAIAAGLLLEQCRRFLDGVPAQVYRKPSRVLMGSTIGQHVRHSLDHFAAAARGLDGEAIDYDHRERDTPVETDKGAAFSRIEALRAALGEADQERAVGGVRVRVMLSGDGREVELGSTLARELAFAAHHAVHHYAMMAAIATEHGLTPPKEFGKAPSTLHHDSSRER